MQTYFYHGPSQYLKFKSAAHHNTLKKKKMQPIPCVDRAVVSSYGKGTPSHTPWHWFIPLRARPWWCFVLSEPAASFAA
jgi:hypothetical protein